MSRGPRRRAPGGPARRCALLAAWLLACGEGAPGPPAAPDAAGDAQGPARTRVVLVGDSITAGQVSRPRGPSYAELLQRTLGPGFEVVNVGCGGASSLDWTRSRGAVWCAGEPALPILYDARAKPALPARFATVLLGTNDSRGTREPRIIPVEEYEAALREIASQLLADGAEQVVLLGPPLIAHQTRAMLRLVRYGDAVRAICAAEPRVVCGPDVRYLLGVDDFAPGNVHPNASGHAKIAAALAPFLRELAERPPGGQPSGASPGEPSQQPGSEASAESSSSGAAQSRSAPADSSSARLP